MGKRSTRENKNIYQLSREAAGLTREEAGEKMVFVSDSRIEKIEYGSAVPHPEEVLTMAACYKDPALRNYYCSHECPIGREYVPEIKVRELPRITLGILANINALSKEKDALIEITADGEISSEELEDFRRIRESLDKMSETIDALRLWADTAMIENMEE